MEERRRLDEVVEAVVVDSCGNSSGGLAPVLGVEVIMRFLHSKIDVRSNQMQKR